MVVDRNTELARRWFEELWSRGNLVVADEIVAEDYAPDWVHMDVKGPAQVKREVAYMRSVFPDLCYDIVETAALPDRVWVRYHASGTHKGNAWGFEPAGKRAEYEGATILYISPGGQIIDRWGAFCFYDIFHSLGLVPAWWELGKTMRDFQVP